MRSMRDIPSTVEVAHHCSFSPRTLLVLAFESGDEVEEDTVSRSTIRIYISRAYVHPIA